MLINFLCVGKRMPAWIDEGIAEYTKRMPREMRIQIITVEAKKRVTEEQALLAAIPNNNFVIALDRLGKTLSTQAIASELSSWRELGQDVCLMVGGSEGLSEACLAHAHQCWSLSALTLPHPLVRVVLAEQIYRAWSILSNHPYHR